MAKKLQWFRINSAIQQAIEGMDSAKVGDALKAALKYFETMGQNPAIENGIKDAETRIAFRLLKQGIDESITEYEARREDGKRGAEAKREKEKQAAIDEVMKRYGGSEPTPNPVPGWTK